MKPNNYYPSESTNKNDDITFWRRGINTTKNFFAKLNLIERASRLLYRVRRFLNSNEGSVFIFFLIPTIFSVGGYLGNSVRLISFAAILWMIIWLTFFGFALLASRTSESKPEEKGKDFFRKKEENEGFAKIQNWLAKMITEFSFTFAGVIISICFIFTHLHIQVARGMTSGFFSENLIGWGVFGILPVIVGRLTDLNQKLRNARQSGKNVILLGIFQFYSSFIILVTSLIGGETAFDAIFHLRKKPWDIFFHDMAAAAYPDSLSFTILEGMGPFAFLLFYFFIPLYFLLFSRFQLKLIAAGENSKFSKNTLWGWIILNIPLLIISFFVGWYEGWIEGIFVIIVVIIGWILQQLIHLYEWIVGMVN